MKPEKKTGNEQGTRNSIQNILETIRHRWDLDTQKNHRVNADETLLLTKEVADEPMETLILTDAVERGDENFGETTIILDRSPEATACGAHKEDAIAETVIQGVGDGPESDIADDSHFHDAGGEEIEETLALSSESSSHLSLHGSQQREMPQTIIQRASVTRDETKAGSDFAEVDIGKIEETVVLSSRSLQEPAPEETRNEIIPETVIQRSSQGESARNPIDSGFSQSDEEQIEETILLSGGSADRELSSEVEDDLDATLEGVLIHQEKESMQVPFRGAWANLGREAQLESQGLYSFESTVRDLAEGIQDIYASNQSDAERVIEKYLEKRLQRFTAEQRMLVLDSLTKLSDTTERRAPHSSQSGSERLWELLSLLMGEKLADLDTTAPEVLERLAQSINTVFDALNQLMGVINFTLLGQQSELETIRHFIGANIEGRETTGKSLEEYLSQIKQAFLISHQAFCQAAETKVAEILAELNPDKISAVAKKRVKFGPFQKAENFETYEERYRTFEKWFFSGRFKQDLMMEFEKNCRVLFVERGGKSEKNQ